MHTLFREMIGTLHQAQQIVRDGMGALQEPDFDRHAASRLLDAVGTFAGQGESLLVMMAERGVDGALADAAEELTGFFRDSEGWIGALLEPSLKEG
jgi:hypothetical protein